MNVQFLRDRLVQEIKAFSKKVFPDTTVETQGYFEDALSNAISDYVESRVQPLEVRIQVLEARLGTVTRSN